MSGKKLTLEEYQHLCDSADSLLCVANEDGHFIFVNKTWTTVLGFTEEELLSRPFVDFVHPEDLAKTEREYQVVVDHNSPQQHFENRYRCKEGGHRWLRWVVSRIENGLIFACATDITDFKTVNEALGDMEDAAKIGYWSVSTKTWTPKWSPGTYHIHGLPEDNKVDLDPAIDFYVGESKKRVEKDFLDCAQTGKSYDDIYRFQNVHGQKLWVRAAGRPRYDDKANIIGVYGIFQDVTESKENELTMRVIRDRLALALEASGIGVWEYDMESTVLHWDDGMFQLYGRTEADFEGSFQDWVSALHPEDKDLAIAEASKCMHERSRFNAQFRIVRPDGEVRFVQSRAMVTKPDFDGVTRFLGINIDITEQVRQKENLERAAEQAVVASKAKSGFLSNMSHEIRTPMNGLIGFLELLEETDLSDLQRQYLETALTSCRSLLILINDILDYSKIEAGRLELVEEKTNLQELLREVQQLFFAEAQKKGLAIKVDCDVDSRACFLLDSLRVKQILSNLLGNAVKFSKKGDVTLKARFDIRSRQLQVEVVDTGVGIAPDQLCSIFEAFDSGDARKTAKFGGTGLGLAIVKQLVELMAGVIRCESTLGHGSRFLFHIRARPTESWESNGKRYDAMQVDGSHLRFLVVEDNKTNQELMMARLETFGINPDLVASGEECLAILETNIYDVILMDIQMPGIDGYETTRTIKERLLSRARIYAVTANAFTEDRDKALEAGMDGHISKPFRRKDIIRFLTELALELEANHEKEPKNRAKKAS